MPPTIELGMEERASDYKVTGEELYMEVAGLQNILVHRTRPLSRRWFIQYLAEF